MFFRAYLLNRVNESIKNNINSILMSSLCFSFGHVDFLVDFPHHIDPTLLLGRFALGYLLGYYYLSQNTESMEHKQKQLWKSILGHGLWNFFVLFIYNSFFTPFLWLFFD